ncbi:hypothetical protein GBAR_LOCUS1424, partial [Geodia barretti]
KEQWAQSCHGESIILHHHPQLTSTICTRNTIAPADIVFILLHTD